MRPKLTRAKDAYGGVLIIDEDIAKEFEAHKSVETGEFPLHIMDEMRKKQGEVNAKRNNNKVRLEKLDISDTVISAGDDIAIEFVQPPEDNAGEALPIAITS